MTDDLILVPTMKDCSGGFVKVSNDCVPGEPHFDPEGAVCANDDQADEAYCSYDVGANACAYCLPPTTQVNGEICDGEVIIVSDTACIPGEPHFDPEGAGCNGDAGYCSYDVGPNVCAYCLPASLPLTSEDQYKLVTSGTCADYGYKTIYDSSKCKAAASSLGKIITWGPYGGYEDVVDGCSLRGDGLFLNPVDICNSTFLIGFWTYTGCQCVDKQPCFCEI